MNHLNRQNPNSDRTGNSNRNTNVTYWFGVLLAIFAFMNIAVLLVSAISSNAIKPTAIIEIIAILGFAFLAVIAARRSRWDSTSLPSYLLIGGILGILFVRNLFTSGLGIIFGIAAAIVTTALAILIINPQRVGYVTAVAYIISASIILLDLYSPFERTPAPLAIQNVALIGVTSITLITVGIILAQFRDLSLYSKISTVLIVAVLLPISIIDYVSINTLKERISIQQNAVLLESAKQTSIYLDTFIQQNLALLKTEGQLPAFALFMEQVDSNQPIDPDLRDKAYRTLQVVQRNDPELVVSYALLDLQGNIIFDTKILNMGGNEADSVAFQRVTTSGLPYVTEVTYSPAYGPIITFAAPIRNATQHIVGILRKTYKASKFQQLVSSLDNLAGEGSHAAILNENNIFIAHGSNRNLILRSAVAISPDKLIELQRSGEIAPGSLEDTSLDLAGMSNGLANIVTNPVFTANPYPPSEDTDPTPYTVAATSMKSRHWTVIFYQPKNAYEAVVSTETRRITLFSILILLGTTIVSLVIARVITSPISSLTKVANEIIEGNIAARAEARTNDEIGALANTFNTMTNQLGSLISGLEERVSERTDELERRANQLHAAAEIGRIAAQQRSVAELLDQAVYLISERFGFYHVGIFLLDERREYAVLHAANSPGGQRMLHRGHKLRVGQLGIVGYVAGSGISRIALDVGDEVTYFDNPDLPDTHSEMALPLIAGGRVIGVLDVQSLQTSAFTEEDTETLQVLADLLTIAIENARLFEEGQSALITAQRSFDELSQVAWKRLIASNENLGFLANADGTLAPIHDAWDDALLMATKTGQIILDDEKLTATIPVVNRGQVIGVIKLKKSDLDTPWNKTELDMAQTLADQLGNALESARLYQDVQKRATVEQALGNITGQISASPEVADIMRTTVEEIGKLLSDTSITISLNPETDQLQDA